MVAAPRDDQVELCGDAAQPDPQLGGVVLVVDLDPGQADLLERGEGLLVEDRPALSMTRISSSPSRLGSTSSALHEMAAEPGVNGSTVSRTFEELDVA